MARLVAAQCPRCGAGVKLDPALDYVTCAYCQTSSFIQRDRRPVAVSAANPPGPVIYVPPERGGPVVVATVVGVVALVAGSLAFAVAGAEARSKSATPPSAQAPKKLPSNRSEVKLAPPITEAGAPILDAEQLISAMSAGFLDCYDRARRVSPTLGGKFALHIQVASDSTETTVESNDFPASLRECMRAAAEPFRFASQPGTTVMRVDGTLTPPLTLEGKACGCAPGDPLCSCF